MTGCGEPTDKSDGTKLAQFKTDPLFAFQPAGAVIESDGTLWISEDLADRDIALQP